MKKVLLLLTVFLLALGTGQFPATAQESAGKDYIVVLKSGQTDNASLQLLKDSGAEILMDALQIGVVNVRSYDPGFLEKLEGNSHILAVSEDLDIRVNEEEGSVLSLHESGTESHERADLYEQYQWDVKRVTENGKSWSINAGNKETLVAVIDTGVDFSHPDLKENLVFGKAFFPGAQPEDAFKDAGSHGTHVAGTIAANGRVMGVGPELAIASYRVSNNQGRMNWTGILTAITTAADDGAVSANLSLGTYSLMNDKQDRALHLSSQRAVQYALKKGMLIIGANGNNGMDLGKRMETDKKTGKVYDGPLFDTFTSIPGVIGVSSSTNRDTLAYYSNYGSSNVNLASPGGDYGPNWPNEAGDTTQRDLEARTLSTIPVSQGSYGWKIGTSMAAPKVAAAAALVKSQFPHLSAQQISTHLQRTAEDLGEPGHDEYFGHGLVNVFNALQ
ncbi:S8 family serine peptidase [Bacillus sp. ISL-45]|uniref:S8 family serine peptidase n=1 Tax=Bacillus sp. ISL-45 TaxID=2819128 RepID=UPI001BE5A776|nr:S8 family serine peptidase [Bacillus sp. ISL-45]MBT2663132.1 S8 family serine peptidase [Bacillus sp. ISL-45]